MAQLLEKKVGEFSIIEALTIAGVKGLEERLMSRVVGNGTLFSGIVKGIVGSVLSSAVGGKFGKITGTAFIIDAGEDIINFLLPASATASLVSGNATARKVL